MSLIENSMLFVRVAQSGSFTTAATLLESSKSQISRRIAHLEQALNVSLFLRTPRGLQLTAVGKQYYDACQAIQISFEIKRNGISCLSEVITDSNTGVEIEAILSVEICLLTIYDMCKYIDKSMVISDIKLISKTGGKSGDFIRDQDD